MASTPSIALVEARAHTHTHTHARHEADGPVTTYAADRIATIRRNLIGSDECVATALGPRKIVYADTTASGRGLAHVEEYIRQNVLPLYANTHTATSECGYQSHMFLAEARDLIRDTINASEKDDVVLFVGRGATAACNALCHFLLRARDRAAAGSETAAAPAFAGRMYVSEVDGGARPATCEFPGCGRTFTSTVDLHMHARTHPDGEATAWLRSPLTAVAAATAFVRAQPVTTPPTDRRHAQPIAHVIIGPYAHHSSILPFRQAGATLHFMQEHERGGVDVLKLAATLVALHERDPGVPVLASMTAASNITGHLCDVPTVNAVCHAFGAVALWDYATAAPHVAIDVNPRTVVSLTVIHPCLADVATRAGISATAVWSTASDAVYFSCHKFVGGPSTPGILCVKRRLLQADSPHLPGGGTVFFVHSDGTPRYLANDAEREEGGSPDLLAAVRAGLVFLTARCIGFDNIAAREAAMAHVARTRWAAHPNLRVLASACAASAAADACLPPSVPVVSFVICAPPGRDSTAALQLHWGFVSAVLNDVFGIQCRGGCLCAGPYAMQLLGIDDARAHELEAALVHKQELLRPGVVRVAFSFHMSAEEAQFIIRAVEWVATHATQLLHVYTPTHDSGEWRINRSAAHGALLEGQRLLRSGMLNAPEFEVLVHPEARQTAGAYTDAALLIAARLQDDAAGHGVQATRGGTKAHPRRWLQDMRLEENGALVFPRYRIALTPEVSEGELFRAYLVEAAVLLAGVTARMPSTAPHHEHSAVLPDASYAHLRWFALATDYLTSPGTSVQPLSTPSYVTPLAMARSRAVTAGHAAFAWCTPPAELVRVLQEVVPSKEQLRMWNGIVHEHAGVPPMHDGDAALPVSAAVKAAPGNKRARGSGKGSTGSGAAAAQAEAATRVTASGSDALPTAMMSSSFKKPRGPDSSAMGITEALLPHASVGGDAVSALPAAPVAARVVHKARPSDAVIAARRARAAQLKQAAAVLGRLPKPAPSLMASLTSSVSHGVLDFDMLRDGDRVLLGLSGGKDSLSLLLLLLHLQQRAPISFDLGACTVDPQYPGYDPSPLRGFLAELGIPYFYASEPVIDLAAAHMNRNSICSWCSRMKRGILYSTARREHYNVLALGQHADDFAESFIMSAFRNGRLRTMKAHYTNDAGDVRIIRPLVYARERQTRELATTMSLPVINENCPACFSGPTERYHVKKLLATEEGTNSLLFGSLSRAIRPLMTSEGELAVRTIAARMGDAPPEGAIAGDADDDQGDECGEDATACATMPLPARAVTASVKPASAPVFERFVYQRLASAAAGVVCEQEAPH